MSSHLWKAFFDDDVSAFQLLLHSASGSHANPSTTRGGGTTPVIGSPALLGSSPNVSAKRRKSVAGTPVAQTCSLTKADINARDRTGQTLLHRAASSTAQSAIAFVTALVEHPWTDLYLQDWESGWTPLHRAFYFGNVSVARLILECDARQAFGKTVSLVKMKDNEGLGPLDLYAATIKDRTLRPQITSKPFNIGVSEEELLAIEIDADPKLAFPSADVNCDQLFTFGSNTNVSLGFGDGDDRQFPERVQLHRPQHLLRRFYTEHLERVERKRTTQDPHYVSKKVDVSSMWIEDIAWLPKSKPLAIKDVQMAKFHTAVLTSDTVSNLYLCGHGKGGRLGTGDEQTRFNFVCVDGGSIADKTVARVALGLNHTLALSDAGEVFSWGNNAWGQLGYGLPKTTGDEDPISVTPRQIFGPLKREVIFGIAASRIHSVAHSASSLYIFGKNEGQLGMTDSDARSLEMQVTPRKVAASLFRASIVSASAIDKATVCLLENHEVWVFANYGYTKVPFPTGGFGDWFLQRSLMPSVNEYAPIVVTKITCGGDSVCALSSRGEIYTVTIGQVQDNHAATSTTNPAKIRSAITKPQRIWSPRRKNMAARDVAVDVDGSIVLSTEEGSVWKRARRLSKKEGLTGAAGGFKPRDYKFTRIPGLTRVLAVRGSAHGAYAAMRSDCDVTRTQIVVEDKTLWNDLLPLLSLRILLPRRWVQDETHDETRHRLWQPAQKKSSELLALNRRIAQSQDIEADLVGLQASMSTHPPIECDAFLATTTSAVRIPVHRFILTGRSRPLRRGFRGLCEASTFTLPDLAVSELDHDGRTVVKFLGIDLLTVIELAFYLYTDSLIRFWNQTREAPAMASRYRQIRLELMKVATKLELGKLELATRQMFSPPGCLDGDLDVAFRDAAFFHDSDVLIVLEDGQVRAHSGILRARCPFFEGLFMGRSGGMWIASRGGEDEVSVDLSHFSAATFEIVLRHIYTDEGAELFDEVVSFGPDDFLDAVLDVMSAANELMLDRLIQVCQEMIGRFVHVRNICGWLNAISPSSVRQFKDVALEYLYLSLEAMLQGHYLNELDPNLLEELDHVVRENQRGYMPFSRSGHKEQLRRQRYPELAMTIARNTQTIVDIFALRAKHSGLETLASGSLGDELSPASQKAHRAVQGSQKRDGPSLKGKESTKDLLFAMDEEAGLSSPMQSPSLRPKAKQAMLDPAVSSPMQSPSLRPKAKQPMLDPAVSSPAADVRCGSLAKRTTSGQSDDQFALGDRASPRTSTRNTPPFGGQPWSSTPFLGPRMDMKDIMAQAASSRTSSLSQGLASAKPLGSSAVTPPQRLSQKERKRRQQAQLSPAPGPSTASPDAQPPPTTAWQGAAATKPASIKDLLHPEHTTPKKPLSPRTPTTPHLTMRQTVAHTKPTPPPQKPTISPANHINLPHRSAPAPASHPRPDAILRPPLAAAPSAPAPSPPPATGLSMSAILAQQQREKDLVRDAAQTRDLPDIQAEQAFQVRPGPSSLTRSRAGVCVCADARRGDRSGGRRSRRVCRRRCV